MKDCTKWSSLLTVYRKSSKLQLRLCFNENRYPWRWMMFSSPALCLLGLSIYYKSNIGNLFLNNTKQIPDTFHMYNLFTWLRLLLYLHNHTGYYSTVMWTARVTHVSSHLNMFCQSVSTICYAVQGKKYTGKNKMRHKYILLTWKLFITPYYEQMFARNLANFSRIFFSLYL